MMPTMPARGRENDRSSMSRRSPKPLRRPSTSMTVSPRRGPGGMAISRRVSSPRAASASACRLVVGGEAGLALGLAGLRGHAHPLQLALERAPAGLVGALLAGQALLLLLQPRRVVALEREAAAAVELEDPAGDVVEEVAVVGDRHDRAGVVLEELLEPVDALGVEVVRRLVEQQQIRTAEQQAAQGDAAPLATRQRRRRRRRRAGSAGRPWRSRRCGRGSRRRRRRSCPPARPAGHRSSRSRRRARPTSP